MQLPESGKEDVLTKVQLIRMATAARISIVFAIVIGTILSGAINSESQNRTQAPTTPTRTKPCSCTAFSIAVVEEDMEKSNGAVVLYVKSDDAAFLKRNFLWTVSTGKIVSGQGTSKITVQIWGPAAVPTPNSTPDKAISEWFLQAADLSSIEFTFGSLLQRHTFLVTVKPSDSTSCSCPPAVLNVSTPLRQIVNQPANVEQLTLDRSNVILSCEPGVAPKADGPFPDPIVNVSTTAKDPENDVLTYEYVVTGGKIVGIGANVKWDLTGVAPGTYTITAGADDGCGVCGATKTQTVTAVACSPLCINISCPDISLSDAKTDNLGEYVITANISGAPSDQQITYNWTVSNAVILIGQGTPSIKIRAWIDPNGSEPVVTLKIGGLDPRGNCLDTANVTIHKG
jgi:hypothetical protein